MNTSRLFLAFLLPILTANSLLAATFVVDDVGDASDAAAGNGTCATAGAVCTLRAAIEEANALAGADIINFSITGVGPHTFTPASELPGLDEAVVIDGTTEPDYTVGAPVIEIDGSGAGGVAGLTPGISGITIKALVINNFAGAAILQAVTGGTTIEGCFIGLDPDGSTVQANLAGIFFDDSSPNNTVGGTTAAARNVISGNTNAGLHVDGSSNVIQGNFIGTDATGTLDRGNSGNGIEIIGTNNTVGGTAAGAGNVISGNNNSGINVNGESNQILGNYIGTDVTGTLDKGNGSGIDLAGSTNTTIGGTTALTRNIISGNGVGIVGQSTTGTIVQGNYIGTDVNGTAALPNDDVGGIDFSDDSSALTIGGTAAGAGNLISGNAGDGLRIDGLATGSVVQGNLIGTDVNGTSALPNGDSGIDLTGEGVTIGGTTAAARNIISGNTTHGIEVSGTVTGSSLVGNYIGVGSDGASPIGNGGDGVAIFDSDFTLGGIAAGSGNVIANNTDSGVTIGSGTGNAVLGNSIYSNGILGIDLDDDDIVTLNDVGDGDAGDNNLQNFPVLTEVNQGSTIVDGTLNSAMNTTFRLEFFSNTACDASAFGEGETYLGTQDVTTDGTGNVTFQVTLAPTAVFGSFITATATDPANNTSEFSACQDVVGVIPTFSEWTMILLAMTMMGYLLLRLRGI